MEGTSDGWHILTPDSDLHEENYDLSGGVGPIVAAHLTKAEMNRYIEEAVDEMGKQDVLAWSCSCLQTCGLYLSLTWPPLCSPAHRGPPRKRSGLRL